MAITRVTATIGTTATIAASDLGVLIAYTANTKSFRFWALLIPGAADAPAIHPPQTIREIQNQKYFHRGSTILNEPEV